ncbi:TRAP transporter small permease [Thalassobius sp. S69A]|uniref:TRAP transporter small permease n=1 Tax=unclassified Thalassovita TaxID=2619711 RepID=UPI000C0E7B19|nr:C4-dicarboxylate ABC transporter substrate-binding protein [Paracoccaceae bacterium]MBT25875.1 C4-dicarboxylate ABC transporter substrate-binding protein [Paracoccaceae bacterium]
MKRAIDIADTVLGHVEKTAALVAGLLILALMTLVCAEVLGRGLFNHPVHGSIDIVEQLMVALVTMGIAYCQSHFGNVRMTLLSDRCRGRAKWLTEVIALTVALFVVVILTKGSWLNLMRSWNNGGDTPEIGIPLWPGIAIVTGALALLGIRLALQLTEALRLLAKPQDSSPIFSHPVDAIETSPYE